MRRIAAVVLVVGITAAASPAGAALPPPPFRLGGTWEGAYVCAGPYPIWLMISGC